MTNYTRGANVPNLEVLSKFCDAGINLNYIVNGQPPILADNEAGRRLKKKFADVPSLPADRRYIYNDSDIQDIVKIVSEVIKQKGYNNDREI